MKLRVASTIGKETTLEVRDDVFGVKLNAPIISQAVRVYLSNQRQGTSKVKTRSEINRTKHKWFKQKGTGNARHGARTPNIFVGGGIAHGPTGLQNWNLKMSSALRRSAIVSALSAQVENIVVSNDIAQLDGKTASAQKMLSKMAPDAKHVLVVLDKPTNLVLRSLRNLENVYVTQAGRLNTYEVAYADVLILTKDAVKMLEERLGQAEKAEVMTDVSAPAEAVVKTESAATKSAAKTKSAVAKKPAIKKPAVKKVSKVSEKK